MTTKASSGVINSIATSQLTGTISNAQLAGSISADKITSLATSQLTGTISNAQLAGSISADKITSLATSQLTGTISNAQLAGSISADKITSLATSQLTGTITGAQLGTGAAVTNLGFTPYNSTNPSGYLTSSTGVTTVNVNGTTASGAISIKGLGFGGEIWNDVYASRSSGTSYTNSRAYPIMVSVGNSQTQLGHTLIAYVNGVLAVSVTGGGNYYTTTQNLQIIVPPGATYSVTTTGVGITYWAELY